MRPLVALLAIAAAGSAFAAPSASSPGDSAEPPTADAPAAPTAPTEQQQSASPKTEAPTEAAKATTPATDAATPVSLAAGDTDAELQLKVLKAQGYKAETHGSEIWFCRREQILGSRFEKKVCNTADQLQHIAADAQQQTDKITRRISGDPRNGGHP
jgi:heme-binding NEAT domain protein